jgi:hypothetical protein
VSGGSIGEHDMAVRRESSRSPLWDCCAADAAASGSEKGRRREAGGGYKPDGVGRLHLEWRFPIIRAVVVAP